jgi:hypothetical protein
MLQGFWNTISAKIIHWRHLWDLLHFWARLGQPVEYLQYGEPAVDRLGIVQPGVKRPQLTPYELEDVHHHRARVDRYRRCLELKPDQSDTLGQRLGGRSRLVRE